MLRPRPLIERLPKYYPPEEGRAGKLRLDFNENTVGCPAGIVSFLRRTLRPEWFSLYPEYGRARRILARYFGVAPEEMLITNGVDDAIKLICDVFVEPGDVLVTPTPTFAIYQFFHAVAGGRTAVVRYDYDAGLRLDVGKMRAVLGRRPRWMALANPNNPTGTLIPKSDLRALLLAAPDTLVLVDEAYFDFSGQTILPWIRRYPNLVVSRTFSKAFGLAGLRLGFLFANARLAGWLRRAHAVYAVNSVAAACAVEAIRHDKEVRQYARQVRANREAFCRTLTEMGLAYAPSAANFVLVRVGARGPEIARRLRAQGILVRDWSHDRRLRGYLRVTVGTEAQMRRLARAWKPLLPVMEPGKGRAAWMDLIRHSPPAVWV